MFITRILNLERQLADIESRLLRVICWGEVCDIDPQTAKVRVVFPDKDNVVSNWLPVMHHSTFGNQIYQMPDMGMQVVVIFPPVGGMENGVVLGGTYNAQDPVPVANADKTQINFSDGTRLEYDRSSHILSASVAGNAEIAASGDVSVSTEANAIITAGGDISATGTNITAQADGLQATVNKGASVTAGAGIVLNAPTITLGGAVTIAGALAATPPAGGGTGSAKFSGDMELKGNLSISGNVSVGGGVTAATVFASAASDNKHTHPGL